MCPPSDVFFMQDFDALPSPVALPADIPATLYTAEQMAAHREAAWQEGHAAARAATEGEALAQIRQTFTAIDAALRATRADLAAQAEATAEELSRFLLAALSAALPEYCTRHGRLEVQAIATEILPALIGEPAIQVRVPATHLPALREHVATLGADLIKKLHFTADDHMGPSDIAISWDQGEAVRDFTQIWQGIATILDQHGLPPLTPAQQNQAHQTAANQTQKREATHVE